MMRVTYRLTHPDGRTLLSEAAGESIHFGRDPSCEIMVGDIDCPMVSGLHARIDSSNGDFFLIHESRSNKTLLNEAAIDDRHRILAGDRVKLGYTGPVIELLSLQSSRSPDVLAKTVQADARRLEVLRTARLEIGRGGVIGRHRDCQFRLDHPRVSPAHAGLASDGDLVAIADLGSSDGTFVNGRRISRPLRLQIGDRVDIGPFSLRFDGSGLVGQSRSNTPDGDESQGSNIAQRLLGWAFWKTRKTAYSAANQ